MPFYKQFDLFDPKQGDVPSHTFSLLPNIVQRARSILHARSRDEILIAAEIVDSMIQDYFDEEEDLFIQAQLQTNGWACKYLEEGVRNAEGLRDLIANGLPDAADPNESFDFPTKDRTTEVDALKDCIDSYRSEHADFTNAKQHEYFAVLALWLIGECLSWLKKERDATGTRGNDRVYFSIAGEYAIQAMDAVGYAEHLSAVSAHFENISHGGPEFYQHQQRIVDMVEAKAARLRSEASREAAAKRHEEDAAMREYAIQYYEKHKSDFNSNEAAARAIAGKIVLAKHRTVVSWISAQRNAGFCQCHLCRGQGSGR